MSHPPANDDSDAVWDDPPNERDGPAPPSFRAVEPPLHRMLRARTPQPPAFKRAPTALPGGYDDLPRRGGSRPLAPGEASGQAADGTARGGVRRELDPAPIRFAIGVGAIRSRRRDWVLRNYRMVKPYDDISNGIA